MTKQSVIRFIAAAAAVCAGIAGYNFWVQKQIAAQVSEMQQPVNEKFDQNVLIAKAQKLASKDYEKPADILPQELKNLDYDKHRDIRFVRENGPWYGKKLPFELQFFHLGSIFQISVPINEVVNGKASRIKYSPQFFDYGRNKLTETAYDNLGYAGFACIRGSTARPITTNWFPFWAPAIFARWPKDRNTAFPPVDWRLTRLWIPVKNFRFSGNSGLKNPYADRKASRFMPCSTARALPAPILL